MIIKSKFHINRQKCVQTDKLLLRLLLLRFSGFDTNPPDFQHRLDCRRVPGPEGLLDVLPDGAPGVARTLPAKTNL